ncbi:MAG TPA: hypothetical protein V6D29_24410 [Leptolyngbyaceae cyanobacterium]
MGIQLKHVTVTTLVMATAILSAASPAFSQQADSTTEVKTVPAGFGDLFYGYSGTYFDNRTIGGQFSNLFGPGGWDSARFPEHEIEWDSDAIHRAFVDHLALQNTLDPTLRVPDLPNPFTTTLLLSPTSQSSGPVVGSEFIFEGAPLPYR